MIRPLCRWQPVRMSIIPCICPMGSFTTLPDVLTAMLSPSSHFSLFRKVCTSTSHRHLCSCTYHVRHPGERHHQHDADFRKFRRQLFHTSLHRVLLSLKPGMTTPEVVRYADGHFRRTIYGLGPYIADYPEQALLACVVQGWCPK